MEKFSRPADEIETLLVNTLDGLPRDNQEKIRAFLGHLSKIFGSEEGFNTELTLLHNKLFCDDASAPLDEARFQEIATDARRGDVYNAVGKAAWNIVEKAAALGRINEALDIARAASQLVQGLVVLDKLDVKDKALLVKHMEPWDAVRKSPKLRKEETPPNETDMKPPGYYCG